MGRLKRSAIYLWITVVTAFYLYFKAREVLG